VKLEMFAKKLKFNNSGSCSGHLKIKSFQIIVQQGRVQFILQLHNFHSLNEFYKLFARERKTLISSGFLQTMLSELKINERLIFSMK
jgi:hypothetical protein